jgi:serine/threonine protein kinase, bacterial
MQGTILGSRYRVIEYIAKGGFGKTYLAEDTQLPGKDKCVVKQLYPSVDDPNFVQVARRLFKTEAETLNTLGVHNQIPQLMAYFEEDEKFYLVQQYIEGHTLSKELVTGETWPEAKVVELLQDCLETLDFIHGKGVIHRDVKPDNLIRRQSDNKLVLVDFGTVKAVIAEQTQLVPPTVAVGTRGYMPTEQARGKPRTTSDIYALGVIAIQALSGVHPTQLLEDDNGEIVWRDKAQCSFQLQEIVAKMTRYHFKERYQSAKEAIAALNSWSAKPQPAPSAPSMEYTPTVQLSDTQLAEMSKRREATAMEASTSASPSAMATPQNLTNFSAEPLEGITENALAHQSEIQSNLATNESNSMPNAQKSGKTLATLGIALVVGAIASGGMYLLNQQTNKTAQKSIEEQVNQFNEMLDKQEYQACYDKAVSLNNQADDAQPANLMPIEQQQEFEARCGLAKAQIEAEDLKYGAALEIAKTLPKNTEIGADLQQQVDTWSEQLLAQAAKVYEQQGNLEKAIETVKQIPQDSSVRSKVIDAKDAWIAESKTNEAIMTTAEKALSEEKWLYAKQQAIKVKDSSPTMYWQEKAKAIISQAEEGIAETDSTNVATPPRTEKSKAIAPTPEIKEVPIPEITKVNKPVVPSVTPKPEPTIRVNQDSSESLRDLDDNSESFPSAPSNSSPPNNAPLRDL